VSNDKRDDIEYRLVEVAANAGLKYAQELRRWSDEMNVVWAEQERRIAAKKRAGEDS